VCQDEQKGRKAFRSKKQQKKAGSQCGKHGGDLGESRWPIQKLTTQEAPIIPGSVRTEAIPGAIRRRQGVQVNPKPVWWKNRPRSREKKKNKKKKKKK